MDCLVDYAPDHPFPIENLPYGIFCSADDASRRPGVAVGDKILDLAALSRSASFQADQAGVPAEVLRESTLNQLIAQPPEAWAKLRAYLQRILARDSGLDTALLVDRLDQGTKLHLPVRIGDYTDFYSSIEHAVNCGTLIRGKEAALQRNWKWLPVGYHGRASSVVVSGTPFHRPSGQILPPSADAPVFAPTQRLDYELEMGFLVGGPPTQLGRRLSPSEARRRLFGCVLLNDWSARDVQTWEYVPLGPFLSKNFCTTISPWIVTCAALEPFKAPQYTHDPPLLDYLVEKDGYNYDVPLTVEMRPEGSSTWTCVGSSALKHTYYTPAQMLAHHTATGCSMNPGDLLGTGTISAPGEGGYGSLLEKSRAGKQPFALCVSTSNGTVMEEHQAEWENKTSRTFIEDGDTVRMSAQVQGEGYCIGFGECVGTVLPAHPL